MKEYKSELRCVAFVLVMMCLFCAISCKNIRDNDANKLYFKEYKIYSQSDSTDTNIRTYVGVINGRKVTYHLYDGKYKCQMIVEESDIAKKDNKK